MKTVLDWLEEAKQQGYDWADAAIRNYEPNFAVVKESESLREALAGAFAWSGSPEGYDYWDGVSERLRADKETTVLEDLIENLGRLNNAIGNLKYNDTLKEPYRTQVYEATRASYEEQLAELNTEIAEELGIEPIKERKLIGWVVQNKDGSYRKRTAPNFIKEDGGWRTLGGIIWSYITPEQAASLCDRLPKWSDDEPIPVYEK